MTLEMMTKSIGKTIQLERGGPDKVIGELAEVRSDHIVLRSEKHGVLYCVSSHIKSVTEPIIPEIHATQPVDTQAVTPPEIPIEEAADLNELLGKLVHTLIAVNHGGPNAVKGVLIEVGADTITLVHEMKDFIHYPIYHIRSLSRIYNVKDDTQQEESDKNKNEQSGKDQSAKNQNDKDQNKH